MAHPWVVDGGDTLKNILNKWSQTVNKCGPPVWVGGGLTTPHHIKVACYEILCRAPMGSCECNNGPLCS
jgi:hypothetical protein